MPFNSLPTVKRNLPGVAAAFGCSFVLAEGDRLACPSFFDWLAENAAPFRLVLLAAPDAVIAVRRAQRAAALRRAQDGSWLAGLASKVRNMTEQYRATRLNAAAPQETVAAQIASALWNPES